MSAYKQGSKMNQEGLTWEEWRNAAGIASSHIDSPEMFSAHHAWESGEDPTEWRCFHNMK